MGKGNKKTRHIEFAPHKKGGIFDISVQDKTSYTRLLIPVSQKKIAEIVTTMFMSLPCEERTRLLQLGQEGLGA